MALPSICSPQFPTFSIPSSPSSYCTLIKENVLSWNPGPRLCLNFPNCPVPNKSCLLHPQPTFCHFQNRPCHSPSPDGFTSLSLLECLSSKTVRLLFISQDQLSPSSTFIDPPKESSSSPLHSLNNLFITACGNLLPS